MQRLCRSLGALSVAFVACFAGSASGAIEVVNTQMVAGRLLTSGNLTLSWDWSWEWVPADATTATVAVRSWRRGELKSASFSRGQATSVAWENLVAGDEDDRLELTLAKGPALTVRFGIRTVEAKDKRIFLNGQPIFLKGVNRHDQCQEFGATTSTSQMVRDLQILKAMNANFIRGAHYQQSQRFLDYCDEMGVLVWEESLGWGNTVEHLKDPEFRRLQKEQTRRMVRTSFNHPSVIVFAFLNENFSYDEAAKSIVGELVDVVKAEDSGRLVTFAVRYFDKDIANDKTDFIAFNLYPGWIHGYPPGSPDVLKGKMDDLFSRIVARYRGLYPEKPLFTSEIGTLAIYGARDESAAQQSEEFQAEYVTDAIERVFADPELCGVAIWQFADSRSFNRGGGNTRNKPMAMNLAGLYDGYRRPKLATRAVREAFAKPAAGERPWQKGEPKR